MKHHITIFFLFFSFYCFQLCEQKLFYDDVDTGKEELDKAGKDYQDPPEYVDDCSTDNSDSV